MLDWGASVELDGPEAGAEVVAAAGCAGAGAGAACDVGGDCWAGALVEDSLFYNVGVVSCAVHARSKRVSRLPLA